MDNKHALVKDLKGFMVSELKLKRGVDDIKDDAQLFGPDGLGIDSLDGLSLGVAAETRYGIKIDPTSDEGKAALSSVNALADHIMKVQKG
jgi:acyl carrier protein